MRERIHLLLENVNGGEGQHIASSLDDFLLKTRKFEKMGSKEDFADAGAR